MAPSEPPGGSGAAKAGAVAGGVVTGEEGAANKKVGGTRAGAAIERAEALVKGDAGAEGGAANEGVVAEQDGRVAAAAAGGEGEHATVDPHRQIGERFAYLAAARHEPAARVFAGREHDGFGAKLFAVVEHDGGARGARQNRAHAGAAAGAAALAQGRVDATHEAQALWSGERCDDLADGDADLREELCGDVVAAQSKHRRQQYGVVLRAGDRACQRLHEARAALFAIGDRGDLVRVKERVLATAEELELERAEATIVVGDVGDVGERRGEERRVRVAIAAQHRDGDRAAARAVEREHGVLCGCRTTRQSEIGREQQAGAAQIDGPIDRQRRQHALVRGAHRVDDVHAELRVGMRCVLARLRDQRLLERARRAKHVFGRRVHVGRHVPCATCERARAGVRVEHQHARASVTRGERRGEPRDACADHQDIGAAHSLRPPSRTRCPSKPRPPAPKRAASSSSCCACAPSIAIARLS